MVHSMSDDFAKGDIYFNILNIIFTASPLPVLCQLPADFTEVALGSVGSSVSGEEEWSKADLHPFNFAAEHLHRQMLLSAAQEKQVSS